MGNYPVKKDDKVINNDGIRQGEIDHDVLGHLHNENDDQPGAPPVKIVDHINLIIEIESRVRGINKHIEIQTPKGITIAKLYNIVKEKANNNFRFPRLMKGRFVLPYEGHRTTFTIEHYEIVDGTRLLYTGRKGKDIGVWGPVTASEISPSTVIQSFPNFKLGWIRRMSNVLNSEECQKLMGAFGFNENNGQPNKYDDTGDFKIEISETILESVLGIDRVATIKQLSRGNKWIFRQVQGRGYSIPFHTDHALQTLHIRLNSDYVGGCLRYVDTDGAIQVVDHSQCTIHDKNLVHGVTALTSGIRCGLFWIQEEDPMEK